MRSSSLRLLKNDAPTPSGLSTSALGGYLAEWISGGEWRGHSNATRDLHQTIADKFVWYLEDKAILSVDARAITQFLTYVKTGHRTDPRGRWANPHNRAEVRKSTVHTYFGRLRTFFAWMVKQDYLDVSPMDRLDVPDNKRDQIQPFTVDEVKALVEACNKSKYPLRDKAIIWLMFDTGVRAAELCGLKLEDLEAAPGRIFVVGKGNKRRCVYYGRHTRSALNAYLRRYDYDGDVTAPLFPCSIGRHVNEAMNRRGLLSLYHRLGELAGLGQVRCSPHTMRHTFAIEFLRAGGSMYTLMEILGHTSLTMTRRYVALADADLAAAASFSPADKAMKNKR